MRNMREATLWSGYMLLLLLAAETGLGADKQDKYSMNSKRSPAAVDRLEAVLEVGGTLNLATGSPSSPGKPKPVKMSAKATLDYCERPLRVPASPDLSARAIRYYDKSVAAIQVGPGSFKPTLREDRRLIGVEIRGPKVLIFSPRGPLTREELDLVDVHGNSLALDRLLPPRAVAVGETWKLGDSLLGVLCGLDTVTQSDAQCVLQSVEKDVAQVEAAGYVAGSVNGLSSTIQIKAKYRFDLQADRITWFGLLVKEEREAGAIGPGLDVVARLQVKITPGAEAPQLTDAALKDLPLEPTDSLRQLAYSLPEAGWETALDRRWLVISERKDLTILRMADGGDYVAQCNISALESGQGKKPTLAEFQEDIREALGKSFQQFVRASEGASEGGYVVYRVVARGEVSRVPIEWIYYRLIDKLGRQLVILFTVEAGMAEKFRESDRELVRAVRFLEPKLAAKPQPEGVKKDQAK